MNVLEVGQRYRCSYPPYISSGGKSVPAGILAYIVLDARNSMFYAVRYDSGQETKIRRDGNIVATSQLAAAFNRTYSQRKTQKKA